MTSLVVLAPAVPAEQPLVAVTDEEDADGVVAVSARGNATTCPYPFCVAVSGTRNASAPPGGGSYGTGGLAVSGTGNAVGLIALSGTGNATSCWGAFFCTAVSGGETWGGDVALAGTRSARQAASFAVSGLGDASTCAWSFRGAIPNAAVAPFGDACGSEAISVTGNASGATAVTVFGDSSGWDTVSVFGDASGLTATTVTGDAHSDCASISCAAISGTGHASGGAHRASACDTLSSYGRPEACTENLPLP